MTSRIHIEDHEVGLFAYGSLLSRESLSHSLGRSYEGPARVCRLEGLRRAYRAAFPNPGFATLSYAGGLKFPERLLYLDLEEDPGSTLPGVLFAVTWEDLFRLDAREIGYERLEVGDRLLDVQTDAPVVAYGAREDTRVDEPRSGLDVVPASYQRLVEDASAALGESFAAAMDRATRRLPPTIVAEDRPVPWIRSGVSS